MSAHAATDESLDTSQNAGLLKRAAMASMIGTTLEWYEFVIYNSMAALIFNKLFFPQFDPIVGTILAFSTYAVGYLSRPFGGIILGALGDKYGRRNVLFITLVLMGGTTFLIGLMPTYATIGIAAPLLLVAIRFLQGVALGGEWAGAVLLSAERSGPKFRGLHASWSMMGPSAGTLLATGAISLCTALLSNEAFESWGWRIPFIASLILVIVGFWIRLGVPESPAFEEMKANETQPDSPIKEVFLDNTRNLVLAAGARIGPDVAYGLLAAFALAYLAQTLKVDRSVAITALLIGSVWHALCVPLFAALSDVVGRRLVYGLGALAMAGWVTVFFPMIGTRDPLMIVLAMSVALIIHAAMYGPQAAFVMEQFPTRVRYSGSSLAYTLGGVLGGGFAPLIFATLQKTFEGLLPFYGYLWVALGVTIVCLLLAKETARRELKS